MKVTLVNRRHLINVVGFLNWMALPNKNGKHSYVLTILAQISINYFMGPFNQ